MIHPTINLVFVNNDESRLFFSWLCGKIRHVEKLEEFIKWHLDVNRKVIMEITHIQRIDFSNDTDAKKWARAYLDSYEKKIRGMRCVSKQAFERFHSLNEEFKKIAFENKDYEKKIRDTSQIFLNKKELLIGKIIFAYRETWFLANQISYPDFKLGSIEEYERWVSANLSNLRELDKSLDNIHHEILKWKK